MSAVVIVCSKAGGSGSICNFTPFTTVLYTAAFSPDLLTVSERPICRVPEPSAALMGITALAREEGLQSAWLYETLSAHVDELVVARITQNRGPKSDKRECMAWPRSFAWATSTSTSSWRPVRSPSFESSLELIGRELEMWCVCSHSNAGFRCGERVGRYR
jgi:hypothetical protein